MKCLPLKNNHSLTNLDLFSLDRDFSELRKTRSAEFLANEKVQDKMILLIND